MRLNDGGTSVVVVAGFQFCLIQYGGQKTESLHCEMNSLHVISKQPTLQACYKATTKFYGLWRQVVSHDRENKHDFVKIVPDKCWNLCVFSKTFPVLLYRFHCNWCVLAVIENWKPNSCSVMEITFREKSLNKIHCLQIWNNCKPFYEANRPSIMNNAHFVKQCPENLFCDIILYGWCCL